MRLELVAPRSEIGNWVVVSRGFGFPCLAVWKSGTIDCRSFFQCFVVYVPSIQQHTEGESVILGLFTICKLTIIGDGVEAK